MHCKEPASIDAFLVGPLAATLQPAPSTDQKWGARRRWRNGSLGRPHWAAKYGYEHKRHDGEKAMHTGGSIAFVFTACEGTLPQFHGGHSGLGDSWICGVCSQPFDSPENLSKHQESPATPEDIAQ
eukprot:2134119-Amphidinium_carterae.1